MSKITSLETFATADVCFVRLTLDTGEVGWGQCSTYYADITAQIFHRQVAVWALGAAVDTATDILPLILRIEEREHKFPGSYRARALAGLDTALWDLLAKRDGVPVTVLLGGSPGSLRAYASSMKRDITPQAEADRLCTLRDTHGFDAFKWRVGAECGHDVDAWPGRTEQVIPVVARALGDGMALLVDGNSGFSTARAIEVAKRLHDEGISHFEEPVPYWDLPATKAVTDAVPMDVTGGEQDCELQIWGQMIGTRAVDVVQPDIMYMGGLAKTLLVADRAAQAGLPCTPHSANLSLVTLASMHLLRAIPNPGKYLELSIEGADYYPWQDGLFVETPYAVTDGKVSVTATPGWGVTVNPVWLEAAQYHKSTLSR